MFLNNIVVRFQSWALAALQDAAESFLVELFADAQLCAIHAFGEMDAHLRAREGLHTIN